MGTYFETRTVGFARVTIASDGILPWRLGYDVPTDEFLAACEDVDAEGLVPLGLNSCHVAVGGASIVVDPPLWDEELRGHFPAYRPAAGLHALVGEIGGKAEEESDAVG